MWESTMKYFSPSFSYMSNCLREDRRGGLRVDFELLRSGDEDRPAADLARVQVVQCVQRARQRVLDGVEGDLAGLREDHELREVVVGAHDVADHVLLAGDEVQGRSPELAAVAEHEAVTGRDGPCPAVRPAPLVRDAV